jgi:hypothetical protein
MRDIQYNFVGVDEKVLPVLIEADTTVFRLKFSPVMSSTLMGTVYNGNVPIQSFTTDENVLEFIDLDSPSLKCLWGRIRNATGEITLKWNGAEVPYNCTLVVYYECIMKNLGR